jgi:hypothetical protein
MDTIAGMISRRLRQIEAHYAAEASGGAEAIARAAAKERRLWARCKATTFWSGPLTAARPSANSPSSPPA